MDDSEPYALILFMCAISVLMLIIAVSHKNEENQVDNVVESQLSDMYYQIDY
jgi:hypothetical protein